jgi:hypothetical protein
MTVWKAALFPSLGKEAPNQGGPLDQAILRLVTTETGKWLRYAPQNRSSPG